MKGLYWLGLGIASLEAFINPCFAQSSNIVPDDSLGAESSQVVDNFQRLPVEVITGGAQRGINLFHSFREFNVSKGRGAYFFSPNAEIQNILTRVTGRNPSEILGTLGTFGNSQPNFFLINPNGIVFGENASLDVGGSFVATTANGIQLGETGFFSATEPATSNLLSVNPSALFFNAVNSQAEIINRSTATSTVLGFALNGDANRPINGLQVLDGKSLLLVGGDVSFDGGKLYAPGGRVELGGFGEGGAVRLGIDGDIFSLSFPDGVERGDVSLANVSGVNTLAGGGGSIAVNARNVDVSSVSQIGAGIGQGLGTIDSQAGDITVNATGETKISLLSVIANVVLLGAKGNSGNININTGSVKLEDRGQFSASVFGQGNAGNITVTSKDAVYLTGNANIFSTVEAGAVGKGGNIDINAASLILNDGSQITTAATLLNASNMQLAGRRDVGNINVKVIDIDIKGVRNGVGSGIFSSVSEGIEGDGGNITIDSSFLNLADGARISASIFGKGNAGNVNVKITEEVEIAGKKNNFASGIRSVVGKGAEGNGGNISINAGSFNLQDLAVVDASTSGKGNAGNVTLSVKDDVFLADSGIVSSVKVGGVGKGGNININSATLTLRDAAQIQTLTNGQGNAGKVIVNTKDAVLLADGQTTILSSVEAGGMGNGGDIDINSANLTLRDGAQLVTGTRRASDTQKAGEGDAGNINLKVTGVVEISGKTDTTFASGIFSQVETGTEGNGGNINIDAASFILIDGGQLSASTIGLGNSGNIHIDAKDGVTISGSGQNGFSSSLFTKTSPNSNGEGGDITVNTNVFRISDAALIDARTLNNNEGGDITLNTNIFEALNGGQLITTTSSKGDAGQIMVNATERVVISSSDSNYNNRVIAFPDRVVNIGANSGLFVDSSGLGNTGDIEINSPQITLDNQGTLNANSTSGNGGNINLTSDLLLMRRGAQISTNAGTAQQGGDGGNIDINSKFIIAPSQENSDITANAYSGTGGNVKILSQGIFGIEPRTQQTDRSDITASSDLGVPGNLNLTDPDDSSIRNNLDDLPDNQIDTNALIANSCIARGTKRQENSFKITGSGGLRNSPGDGFISEYSTGDVRNVEGNIEANSRAWKKGDRIVEPTGLYKLSDGRLLLSRTC